MFINAQENFVKLVFNDVFFNSTEYFSQFKQVFNSKKGLGRNILLTEK